MSRYLRLSLVINLVLFAIIIAPKTKPFRKLDSNLPATKPIFAGPILTPWNSPGPFQASVSFPLPQLRPQGRKVKTCMQDLPSEYPFQIRNQELIKSPQSTLEGCFEITERTQNALTLFRAQCNPASPFYSAIVQMKEALPTVWGAPISADPCAELQRAVDDAIVLDTFKETPVAEIFNYEILDTLLNSYQWGPDVARRDKAVEIAKRLFILLPERGAPTLLAAALDNEGWKSREIRGVTSADLERALAAMKRQEPQSPLYVEYAFLYDIHKHSSPRELDGVIESFVLAHPNSGMPFWYLAKLAIREGRIADARRQLDKAVSVEPYNLRYQETVQQIQSPTPASVYELTPILLKTEGN